MVTVKGAIMKRSLIAIAALLLLLTSATYANPPRPRPRARFFLGPVLAWFGFGHHWQIRSCPPAHRPPAILHKPKPGWHFGWQRGRHNGWKNDDRSHQRPGNDRPHQNEQRNPRGRDRGRG
jgi:hypothetical protein